MLKQLASSNIGHFFSTVVYSYYLTDQHICLYNFLSQKFNNFQKPFGKTYR